jgi:signal transduction histidine kinase
MMQQLGAALKRVGIKSGIVLGAWTLLAFVLALHEYAVLAARGTPTSFFRLLRWAAVDYWIWAALTPCVFWTASKIRFTRKRLAAILAVHCLASVAFSVLHVGVAMLVGVPRGAAATGVSLAALKARLLLEFFSDLWMYWPLVGLWNLIDYRKRYRERMMHALQLESKLAKAQLEALRSQMQPHFLFNTLNSISALMQEDVKAAEDMLADLSYMLRVSLRGGGMQEVTLANELELLEAYVRIQKRRFEDHLHIEIEIPAETLDTLVPSLVLQPLVENAVRHGIAPLSRGGTIRVASERFQDMLVITVSDNGCGLPPDYREGIGLGNTRERLKHLYGSSEAKLDVRNNPDHGVSVAMTLPFRYAEYPAQEQEHEDLNDHSGRRTTGTPANSLAARN